MGAVKVNIIFETVWFLVKAGSLLCVWKNITTCLKILLIFCRLYYAAALCDFKTLQSQTEVGSEIERDTIFIIKAKLVLPPLTQQNILARKMLFSPAHPFFFYA